MKGAIALELKELQGAIYRCHHCRACSLADSDEIGWHRVRTPVFGKGES